MYPVLILAISIMLTTLMNGVMGQNRDLVGLYRSRLVTMQTIAMAENIEQFYLEKVAFPATIDALGSTAGFEHSRSLKNAWQGYAVSPTISDGVWQFSRAVLISNDPSRGIDAAAYLGANACGVGGYDTATSWCGSPKGQWFRRESRERYNDQMATQRVRMVRVLQKLTDYYNKAGKFPDKDSGGSALAANSINALSTLGGFAGAADTCSGTYTYMGVPIDCGDMYDLWGNAIGYQFVGAKHIVLISETPILNDSGDRVLVAVDHDNSIL